MIGEKRINEIVKETIDDYGYAKLISINESSLNRVIGYITGEGHNGETGDARNVMPKDIALITASRKVFMNGTPHTLENLKGTPEDLKKTEGDTYTKGEIRNRNRELKAALVELGYGVTSVSGNYVESYETKDAFEVNEPSFFVVNLHDDPNFLKNIFGLSEYYNQDSFLYKSKDEEHAFIVGTNNSDFPGFGNSVDAGTLKTKRNAEFLTRVGNSSFAFSSEDDMGEQMPTSFQKRKSARKTKNAIEECSIYDSFLFEQKRAIDSANLRQARKLMAQNPLNAMISEKRINNIVKETLDNFLHEDMGFTYNHAKMVSINENDIKRMVTTHSKDGYIVISPCRSGSDFGINPNSDKQSADKLAQINNKRVKDMIADIKSSGFSYTPVYGGFTENLGTGNETKVYERSFIIYNKDKHGNSGDFNDLYDFGLTLCHKYNQDSYLVQAPNDKPKYINQNGEVDFEFEGGMTFNDISQEYFTDLHKNTDRFGDMTDRKPTRFSFTEAYVNPKPQCYGERHVRWLNGEVF